jgi:hypothetical protein
MSDEPPTPYERFKALAKRVVAVPKKEVEDKVRAPKRVRKRRKA